MDQRNSRNALIACGVFFMLMFIMMTVHSYGEALKSMRPQHQDSDVYDDILLIKPKKYGSEEEIPKYNNSVVNKTTLGNYAWTVLHLMSLKYPENPTPMEQKKMSIFLHLFAEFYPCPECSEHFLQHLEKNPVQASSKYEFMVYLCQMHNIVNEMLGKPKFDCNPTNVEQRWGGDCGCDLNNQDGAEGNSPSPNNENNAAPKEN